MRKLISSAVLAGFFLIAASTQAATHYIDFAGGNDANNGLSPTTAWQRLPGMPGCAAVCAAKRPAAGDRFLLKGGVTWPNQALGINWQWVGTAANPIYIGVDFTYFTGPSWTRPILNGGGQVVANGNRFFNAASFTILDNIEFTGLFWSGTPAFCQAVYICLGQQRGNELKNLYFHGWSYTGTSDTPCAVIGDTHYPNENFGSSLHDSVIDGSDTDRVSCVNAVFGGPPIIFNMIVRNAASGFVLNGPQEFRNNLIENVHRSFQATTHGNGFESNCDDGLKFFNNVVRSTNLSTTGSRAAPGVTVWMAPAGGKTSYAYNNVIYDATPGNIFALAADAPQVCPGSGPVGRIELYNNTIECGPDTNPNQRCFDVPVLLPAIVRNNHFITNLASAMSGAPVASNNVTQSKSAANTQGYNMAGAFAPLVNGPRGTAGAGLNLLVTALPGIGLDSRGQPRPVGVTWDVGAYQIPIAPLNLRTP